MRINSLDFYWAKHIFFMLTTHINVECSVNRAGTIDVMVVSPALFTELFIMWNYVKKWIKNYVWLKFWRLSIISEWPRKMYWKSKTLFRTLNYICDCGSKWNSDLNSIKRWCTTSCGCLQKEKTTKRWLFVWWKRNKVYDSRRGIISRCNNIKDKYYWWRWITYDAKRETFEWFCEDMKDWRREWLTIDRIDNNWNYCKENCKRSTMKQQTRNRSNNIIYWWRCVWEWQEQLWYSWNKTLSILKNTYE